MHKAFIIALALTSLGALTTPAFASKKCRSTLSHCLYKSNHCTDKKDCQIECLDEYNYCTMSHDMSSSGKPAESRKNGVAPLCESLRPPLGHAITRGDRRLSDAKD